MRRPLLLAALALAPLAAAAEPRTEPSTEPAAAPLVLTLGTDRAGTAELVFSPAMTARDAFALRTARVGAPGSVVRVEVDFIPYPLLERRLAPEDCFFATGEAVCELHIEGGTREHADLVAAFRAGLDAHLEVRTGGHGPMRSTTSLLGFADAFAGL